MITDLCTSTKFPFCTLKRHKNWVQILSASRDQPIVPSLCQTLIDVASDLLHHLTEKSACISVMRLYWWFPDFKQLLYHYDVVKPQNVQD